MKTSSFILLLALCCFISSTTAAVPSKKLKGAKQSRKVVVAERRDLHVAGIHSHGDEKAKGKHKHLVGGPTARSCTYKGGEADLNKESSASLKEGRGGKASNEKTTNNKQEMKFSCSARSNTNVAAARDGRGITLNPAEIKDKIQYKVKTDNKGLQVKVEYKTEYQEAYGVDDYQDSKTSFEILFDSLVEYAKVSPAATTEQDQAFDWTSDIVVQTMELNQWDVMTTVRDSLDGVVSYFTVQSMDQVTLFNFTISRANLGQHITANTMKIDVRITNFPWLRRDTNLALMSTVKSKLKVEMSYNDQASLYGRQPGATTPTTASSNTMYYNQQPPPKQSKWTENVFVSFDEAAQDIGFVPFGDYTWDDHAQATPTPPVLADNVYNSPLCNPSLLARAQAVDATVTAPPGCDNSTLSTQPPMDPYLVEPSSAAIQVVATSPPPTTMGLENHQHIAYSFVGAKAQYAQEIYWDPQAGIGYSEPEEDALESSSVLSGASKSWGRTASLLMIVGGLWHLAF